MKYTFVSVPALGHKQNTFFNIKDKLSEYAETYAFDIPEFKVGTLDALVLLSDDLVKYDTALEQSVNKLADILNSLVKDKVRDHLLVSDKTIDQYIRTFQWNSMKYRTDKSLQETTALLNQEVASIDAIIKAKLNSYTQNKNVLQTLQRKQTGNLSVRSLNGIVKKQHCVLNSEYLTTLIVAVPKNLYKQWNGKYETLTSMVVPRSSVKIAEDDEFGLFTVTLFQRVVDEFSHKAREERFIVRDFKYDETALQTQQQELEEAAATEREQQAELVRLTRTNFGEVCASWVHLKALRVFVESVLRYGLPADFTAVSIAAKPKVEHKVDEVLLAQYGGLGGVHGQALKKQSETHEELLDHELQSVNDSNYRPYVQFELNFDADRSR
ncbi:Vacuolar ATP synthase subunit C [Apophysomyces ossiformis]|uniref:V-type proton ATPase subunit C n=1 Tax=Apophysomyces ossiformis TaxID=679940 RepID=A0A8H7ESF0_9FUNG|nr:Vacuolar ATP synthase subunit C [Apophysomyces ossiformis]